MSKPIIRILLALLSIAALGIAIVQFACGNPARCFATPMITTSGPAAAAASLPALTATAAQSVATVAPAATSIAPPRVVASAPPAQAAQKATAAAQPVASATQPVASATQPVAATSEPSPFPGLAILGDSTEDEYRADNPRGGEYGDHTFNWAEQLVRFRNINMGSWGERPEPRRSGYEYNWARSGATTDSLLSTGQHTGAAEQIRAGQVSHVIIQIGINDFVHDGLGTGIYTGQLSGPTLEAKLKHMVDNVDLAVQTLKAAGNVQILVAATQDYVTPLALPEIEQSAQDPSGQKRVIAAFAYVNRELAAMAAQEQVTFFDFNAVFQADLAARRAPDNALRVGNQLVSLAKKGNEPHSAFVDDEYAHPGTVISGLMANAYITELNRVFGTMMTPFSDDELLQHAGITP